MSRPDFREQRCLILQWAETKCSIISLEMQQPLQIKRLTWRSYSWNGCLVSRRFCVKSKLTGHLKIKRCALHTYFWKCIFSSSNTKSIHEQCIISERKKKNNKRNTVWKHPCYLISKYKTSTNNLLQHSKKSVLFFLFNFSSFFLKQVKSVLRGEWHGWVFPHFICWRIH